MPFWAMKAMGPAPVTALFETEAVVLHWRNDALDGLAGDVDPVLLELVDLVTTDRAASAVEVVDGMAVLHAAERGFVS